MTADQFMANFGHIAHAPGGVGKLRDLIYHFAFAGELVAHSRESAAELAKILAQTESPTGKTRRAMLEPAAGFYPIPPHWLWVNIGDVGHDWGQTKPSGDFTYIDVSAIDNHRGVVADGASIVSAENAPSRARKVVKKGTVIYSTVRPYLLNIAVIERDFDPSPIASTAFAILHPHDGVEAKFVYYFLRSPAFVAYVEKVQSGIAYPAISDQKFFAASFPLAPTEEQKRIVKKVDELMALCDQLEAQQQERERRFPVLSRTCHARFADDPTPANLNRIFDESGAVSPTDLRKTIRSLAVRGKLIAQDIDDEPAAALIRRVAAKLPEKKSENPFIDQIEPSITDESEYDLPSGWSWLPLGHVGIWATGCGFPTQYQGKTDGDFLFCKVSDMNLPGNEVEIHATVNYINADVMNTIRARANPVGTVIFPKIGGAIATHKRRLVIQPTIIDNNCSGIKPIGLTDNQWLLLFMRSLDLTKYQSGTSVPAVSQGSLDPIRIGLPPLAEQRRIVAKVDELMALVDHLEAQQQERDELAESFAKACVASFTGTTQLEKTEKMKAPKTELVSLVTLSKKPEAGADAPLAALLIKHGGELSAKALWQQSGLSIDAFYQQLKFEITQGWIAPPAEAEMRVVEVA
jgi:type I restriction enzyme S subunit